jgi:uncharacterized damage-inducible protein DinB
MYNSKSLLDIHGRAHESLRRLDRICNAGISGTRHRGGAGHATPDDQRSRPDASASAGGVIMRVVTHIFNHEGQVLAMCRSMGKPNVPIDLDYPVD